MNMTTVGYCLFLMKIKHHRNLETILTPFINSISELAVTLNEFKDSIKTCYVTENVDCPGRG